jgi:two-component system, sensor histidine kinase PdtaS
MKRFIWLMCLLIEVTFSLAQDITRQDADSMLSALNKSKPDVHRLDLLLNLAQYYILKPGENQIDFDSASAYMNKAAFLNKTVKSSAAYGYQLLTESYMLREKGEKTKGKEMVEKAVKILETDGNKGYLGKAYFELAMYYDYRDTRESTVRVALVQRSTDLFQQAGDVVRKAKSLEMLGDLYLARDECDKAVDALEQSLAAYDSAKVQKVQGVYVLLGVVNNELGKYGQALYYLLKALKTAQTLKDTSMQLCQINNYLGNFYSQIDRLESALKYYNDALEIAKKYKDQSAIFVLVRNLCKAYYDSNQPNEALKVLSVFPKKYITSGSFIQQYMLNSSFLMTYMSLGQLRLAQPYCDLLLIIVDSNLVQPNVKENIYKMVANYHFLMKQYSKSRYYLLKSMREIKSDNDIIQQLKLAYKLDSAQGKIRAAFNNLLLFKTKTDSVTSERKIRQLEVMNVEYQLGMKDDSIKIKNKDIALLVQKNSLTLANLRQASLIKNITIAVIILAVIIIALLYRQYLQKQKSNQLITSKNQQLEHLLNEKEWLLKEIHHRVKNNLQIVMSLLNSQSAYIDNEPALTAIHDSQHRVQAMSLIHQKLYGSDNVSTINMSLYIRELATYLSDSFDTAQRIRFKYDIEPLEMDVSQAVPLGLILNEAITNSLKYAYPEGRMGTISISLSSTAPQHYLLVISDDGIGIATDLKTKKGSLGMSLMQGLSGDLDGEFSLENGHGTTIRIVFTQDKIVKRSEAFFVPLVSSN